METSDKKKHVAIVLAAGKGARMKSDLPKQFLPVLGKPLICYALETFQNSFIDEIILVTSEGWLTYCQEEIVHTHGFSKVRKVIVGGAERYDSVYAGICAAEDADYFYIHDGARPAVTAEILERGRESVEQNDVAIAGVLSKDTIKMVDVNQVVVDTPDRSFLWNVQTPQIFKADLIREAYARMYDQNLQNTIKITDDAMLVEQIMKQEVRMYEGDYRNIKVTTPEDIWLIEIILKNSKNMLDTLT